MGTPTAYGLEGRKGAVLAIVAPRSSVGMSGPAGVVAGLKILEPQELGVEASGSVACRSRLARAFLANIFGGGLLFGHDRALCRGHAGGGVQGDQQR